MVPDLGDRDYLFPHQAHLPISLLGSGQAILIFRIGPEIQLILFLGPTLKLFLINFTPLSLNLPCSRNAPFHLHSLLSMLLTGLCGPFFELQWTV